MNDTIKPEIKCAAKWWADRLREDPHQDNGDLFQSALMTGLASRIPRPTDEQIQTFEATLAEHIAQQPGFHGESWRPADPIWGGAYRGLYVDYHPTVEMETAAKLAGIVGIRFLLPIKTSMHINPGSVMVGHGYRAPLTEIYVGVA
jgi:BTG family protein